MYVLFSLEIISFENELLYNVHDCLKWCRINYRVKISNGATKNKIHKM